MTDFNKLVKGLSSEEVSSLMYALCCSGKLVVSQFYTSEHMTKWNKGVELTPDQIVSIQGKMNYDDKLHDDVLESFMYHLEN